MLTARAFNQLDQYAISPSNRAYCYTELAISSTAVAVTITSTEDGQAKSAWVVENIPNG